MGICLRRARLVALINGTAGWDLRSLPGEGQVDAIVAVVPR